MGGHLRTNAQRRPAPDRVAHPAKPGFILKHQPQRLVRVTNRHGVHFGLKFFKKRPGPPDCLRDAWGGE
jgi:hypothetical protein